MTRVVLIDDEPWSREVVKSLVDWSGLELRLAGEAEDGTQGMALVAATQPHIVITDMKMPGLDGAELLRELEERFPLLKIVVMSGYDDVQYLRQAIRSRAVEYLMKPLDATELNQALTRCLDELSRARRNAVPQVLPRPLVELADVERYQAFRAEARAALLDATVALDPLFDRLRAFLAQAWGGDEPWGWPAKVLLDYQGLLDERLAEAGVEVPATRLEPGIDTFSAVVAHLKENYRSAAHLLEEQRNRRGRLDWTLVEAYVDSHFLEPLSLEQLSQQFYVNREHLSRSFKLRFGENLSDRITRLRMGKARELLETTPMAIKHVALVAGYEDLGYFYRVFKKHFGLTPRQLRAGDDEKPQ